MYGAARASRPLVVEPPLPAYDLQDNGAGLAASDDPGEIQLYTGSWVGGTRAVAHFGAVMAEVFSAYTSELPLDWERSSSELNEIVRAKARELGANAVVGMDVSADPWAVDSEGRIGLRLNAVGTAARLVPLW